MKAILLSIRPQFVAKILNGEKTIEIRKQFPRDYVGWVYIYCTKNGGMTYKYDDNKYHATSVKNYLPHYCINGKVVARFWCDKVEQYANGGNWTRYKKDEGQEDNILDLSDYLNDNILEKSCLTDDELRNYVDDLTFSAIHITKLEIFDKPKELGEFKKCYRSKGYPQNQSWYLTRAPQSYCFIEV